MKSAAIFLGWLLASWGQGTPLGAAAQAGQAAGTGPAVQVASAARGRRGGYQRQRGGPVTASRGALH